jgi:tetratricopeptide (TPR) repeat protein
MRRLIWLLAICLLVGGGCAVHRPRLVKTPNTLPADPRLSSLERAELLRSQGDHIAATIEYRKVIESAEDPMEREEARIGAAKSLIKLHRLPAAMAVLGPLPVQPMSEWDSRKLAIAGEIYLREHRHEEAETCLELALDACPLEVALNPASRRKALQPGTSPGGVDSVRPANHQVGVDPQWTETQPEVIPPGTPLHIPAPLGPGAGGAELDREGGLPEFAGITPLPCWMAGACANLGCAYLKNDKPEKAAILYEYAAVVFRMQGNHVAAERAQRVSDDLNAVLRQYAPYKPPPVTQGFPPGRK